MGILDSLFGGRPDEITKTSGGTSTSTTAQNVAIPEFLRPLLEQSAGTAGGALSALSGRINQGGLVAPFSPDQELAFGLARDLATGPGSPLGVGLQTFVDTAAGRGFESEAFNDAFGALVRRQQPGIISPFIAAGRGTGGLAQTALGQAQADAFASLFNQERQRQLAAAQGIPGLALTPFNLLSGVGAAQQGQAQQEISAPIQAQLGLLAAAQGGLPISGLLGRTATTTGTTTGSESQPLFENKGAGLLGGALTGAQLGSTFGPIGTGIGAIGGGLLGAFG